MQNFFIAAIILLIEWVVLGLVGIFLFFRARHAGWNSRIKRRQDSQIQELKLLAYHVAQAHDGLMKQYQSLSAFSSGKESALAPHEGVLCKAIDQLRLTASQLTMGRSSPLQVTQDLLLVQESLIAALSELAKVSPPAVSAAGVIAHQAAPIAPMASDPLLKGDPDRTEIYDIPELVSEPVKDPPKETETKTEADLQAEINALLGGGGPPESGKPAEEAPPRKKTEAEIEAEMQADVDEMLASNQSSGVGGNPVEVDLQAEIDGLLGTTEPDVAPRKKTEAEIEAEMQADVDEMLASNQSSGAGGNPVEVDLQAEIDGLLGDATEAQAAPRKKTEAEIEAEMQADVDEMLANAPPEKVAVNLSEDELQAELDALLNMEKKKPVTAPVSAPPAPKKSLEEIKAEREEDLALFNAAEGPTTPKSNEDLQAELDALLSGMAG